MWWLYYVRKTEQGLQSYQLIWMVKQVSQRGGNLLKKKDKILKLAFFLGRDLFHFLFILVQDPVFFLFFSWSKACFLSFFFSWSRTCFLSFFSIFLLFFCLVKSVCVSLIIFNSHLCAQPHLYENSQKALFFSEKRIYR